MQPLSSSSSLHLFPLINRIKWPSRFPAHPATEPFPRKPSFLLQGDDVRFAPAVSSRNDRMTHLYLDKHVVPQHQISSFSDVVLSGTLEELVLQVDKALCEVCPNPTAFASFYKKHIAETIRKLANDVDMRKKLFWISTLSIGQFSVLPAQVAHADEIIKPDAVYEIAEFFELGIQLSYLLLLLALVGVGTFYVIRQVLMRRELDLSAKELQEQVRSGDASAIEYFELGAVMLRRKFYPAAIKYFLQAIDKWDSDDQDLSQVYNALGVSYARDGKLDKAIVQFEKAVKLQPGYVIAWNNLGDAYDKKKEYKSALRAFEEALLFDPNNEVALPRRDALKEQVKMYKGVPIKFTQRKRIGVEESDQYRMELNAYLLSKLQSTRLLISRDVKRLVAPNVS